MKKLVFKISILISIVFAVSLTSCSAVFYDIYFSQGIDSTQKFRLIIDGENFGFLPFSSKLKDCADTSALRHAKLLEGIFKIQVRNLSDEVVISQNLRVTDKGVSISGTVLSGEVKATSDCAMTHFFISK